MDPIADEVVFSLEDTEYRWRDVVRAAQFWGDWAEVERRTAQGIACRRRLDDSGEEIAPDDLEAAGNAWRYDRNLLAADELEVWLDERGVDPQGWMEYLRRVLLRDRWAADLDEIERRYPARANEIAAFIMVEATCSGTLDTLAAKLAGRAAASTPGAADPARLEHGYTRFVDSVTTPGALQREVDRRALEWTRLECRTVALAREQVAREVSLLVLEDGMDLSEAAAEAGVRVRTQEWFLEDAETPLRDHLLGAQPGQLIGPVPAEDGFALLAIDRRIPPSLEDGAVRARAERVVVEAAVEAEIGKRVRWRRHG